MCERRGALGWDLRKSIILISQFYQLRRIIIFFKSDFLFIGIASKSNFLIRSSSCGKNLMMFHCAYEK